MKKFILILCKYFLPLLTFFIIETLSHGNEFIPLIFVFLYGGYLYKSSKKRKAEIILASVGFSIGLIIEVGMTQFSRAQIWENTIFAVPLWLPFAWAVGAVVFYRFGKEFE